jgi:hypothetical protein
VALRKSRGAVHRERCVFVTGLSWILEVGEDWCRRRSLAGERAVRIIRSTVRARRAHVRRRVGLTAVPDLRQATVETFHGEGGTALLATGRGAHRTVREAVASGLGARVRRIAQLSVDAIRACRLDFNRWGGSFSLRHDRSGTPTTPRGAATQDDSMYSKGESHAPHDPTVALALVRISAEDGESRASGGLVGRLTSKPGKPIAARRVPGGRPHHRETLARVVHS